MNVWLAGALLALGQQAVATPAAKQAPPAPAASAAPIGDKPIGDKPTGGDKSTGANRSTGGDKQEERDQGLSFGARQIVGRVQSFEPAQKTMVIESEGQRQPVKLTDDTTVFVEGRLGSALDLKEGAQVRAAFENEAGSRTLRWIEIAPATKPATTANRNELTFEGHIVAIEGDGKRVTVSHGDDRKTFELGEATKIVGSNGPVTRADLREGQEVRASFRRGEPLKASKLEVVLAPSTEQPKKP